MDFYKKYVNTLDIGDEYPRRTSRDSTGRLSPMLSSMIFGEGEIQKQRSSMMSYRDMNKSKSSDIFP